MHRQLNCHPRRATRSLPRVFAVGTLLAALGFLPTSCTTRPVVSQPPTLFDVVTPEYKQQSIDKIDLLFMIDNSASMGDKQEYLKLAIPDLVNRLVSPN